VTVPVATATPGATVNARTLNDLGCTVRVNLVLAFFTTCVRLLCELANLVASSGTKVALTAREPNFSGDD
jgi:hypothetical protein